MQTYVKLLVKRAAAARTAFMDCQVDQQTACRAGAKTKAVKLMDMDVSSRPLIAHTGMTLTDAAYRQLRADIIAGVRPPTERLRIERLSRIYGVGPTPLREALQRLAADGLVIATGNRGFSVAPLDTAEFEDLNTARTAIELQMLRMAIERGDAMWESRVVAAAYRLGKLDAQLKSDDRETLSEWETANRDFHFATVSACGSKWLLNIRSMLHDQCERYRRASVDLKRHERDLAAEHRQIADAILERDPDRACDLVAEHFRRTTQFLVQMLDDCD